MKKNFEKKEVIRQSQIMDKSITIKGAFREGWALWKDNWLFMGGVILLWYFVLPGIQSLVSTNLPETATFARVVFFLGYLLISLLVGMGVFTISIKMARKEVATWNDFFSKFHLFPSYLWGMILYTLAVWGGLLLLIIPGFIFGIKFCLWPYFVLDKGFDGVQSLRASNQAVYGFKWNLFFLAVVSWLVNILGILCLGIGFLITAPLTYLIWARVYLTLSEPS